VLAYQRTYHFIQLILFFDHTPLWVVSLLSKLGFATIFKNILVVSGQVMADRYCCAFFGKVILWLAKMLVELVAPQLH
jgi:hypothetical protein